MVSRLSSPYCIEFMQIIIAIENYILQAIVWILFDSLKHVLLPLLKCMLKCGQICFVVRVAGPSYSCGRYASIFRDRSFVCIR